MILLQYRFSADDIDESSYVGREISSFFRGANEQNMIVVFAATPSRGGAERKRLHIPDLSSIAAQSFQESYRLANIDWSKRASIKSLESCRFVVFEDEGLVRICYSNDDDAIRFEKLSPQVADVSNLLVETDLFDFL
jgi:hypothetical protein